MTLIFFFASIYGLRRLRKKKIEFVEYNISPRSNWEQQLSVICLNWPNEVGGFLLVSRSICTSIHHLEPSIHSWWNALIFWKRNSNLDTRTLEHTHRYLLTDICCRANEYIGPINYSLRNFVDDILSTITRQRYFLIFIRSH